MSPNRSPEISEIVTAKPRTTRSIVISDRRGRFDGSAATRTRRPTYAKPTPSAPPTRARVRLSIRSLPRDACPARTQHNANGRFLSA